MIKILMATYNGAKYLEEQIKSILNQTHTDWKLYISDDGSKDDTRAIIDCLVQEYPDKIYRLLHENRFGNAKLNFTYLLKNVEVEESDYFMFSDQDDYWLPSKIEETLEKIQEIERKHAEGTPILVHTDLSIVDHQLKDLNLSFVRNSKLNPSMNSLNALLVQNNVTGCTVMFNQAVAKYYDRTSLDDFTDILMHDSWAALIAATFGELAYLDKKTILYRQHESNQVGAKDANNIRYMFSQLFKFLKSDLKFDLPKRNARKFNEVYGQDMDKGSKDVVDAYLNLFEKNFFYRVKTVIRYKFYAQGFIRKWAQFLLYVVFA